MYPSYALQWLTVLPLEIIAASLTLEYWNKDITRAPFVTLFLAIILGINMFGVKGYGEAEFIFSSIKVIAVIGFMYVTAATSLKSLVLLTIFTVFSVSSLTLVARPSVATSEASTGMTPEPSIMASRDSVASWSRQPSPSPEQNWWVWLQLRRRIHENRYPPP